MREARIIKRPKYPKAWLSLSQGENVRIELERAIAPILERVFGYYLVKLGNLSSQLDASACPIKNQYNLAQNTQDACHVQSKSCRLPLQNNSVDAFLLTAELDFAQDPHQIIREIDRAITANGHVIIAGFNPFSLAGVMKYLPINRKNILHQGRFFTAARIKDWLQLLDFEIIQQEQVMYSGLFMRKTLNQKSRIQKWCKRYLPWFSSMYIIVARKREIPLSPIKPKWQLNPKFASSPAAASIRTELYHLIKESNDIKEEDDVVA
ncbi:methyltransferase domain-containing protein [Ningiella sp. W23]|uniref:methyltransferase domain-containing protein n=1 Tax=Ningiella sp. W23 TaxID=3023715 RepID=UPI0037573F6C